MVKTEKLTVNAIIEMLGSPKEHIEETIKLYIDKIDEDYKEIKVIKKDIPEAKEKEDEKGLFNVFAEIELEVNGIENLTWFCIDYMPSSIEILDPAEIIYDSADMTGFINDLLAKLHQIGAELKKFNIMNQTLSQNGVTLMKNIILLQLQSGPKAIKSLSKGAGVPEDHVEKFLQVMLKDGKVKKDGNKYTLNK